jgi:hypothetical protein
MEDEEIKQYLGDVLRLLRANSASLYFSISSGATAHSSMVDSKNFRSLIYIGKPRFWMSDADSEFCLDSRLTGFSWDRGIDKIKSATLLPESRTFIEIALDLASFTEPDMSGQVGAFSF